MSDGLRYVCRTPSPQSESAARIATQADRPRSSMGVKR